MSDIKKGYTFTDKSTDWVSNKETAIRLNKMLDDAKLNLVAGTNVSITPTPNGPSISATGGTGTVTSVNLTAGTGVSVSGGPITASGSITVNNTAPDQVVSLTGAGTTTVTGTYPSFTISSADSTTGTVTSVAATAGTGINVSGSPITSSGTLSITNSAPDQVVSLTGTGTTTITGTYPSFTINSADQHVGTVTAVTGTLPILSSGGTAPDISINAATTLLPGSMSAADKSKLDAATSANTVSAIVARDASGNFTATTITAALTGNASTVTTNANLTGAVTSVGNATTVVTNANLTGDVTSTGNATAIASDVIVNADINSGADIAYSKLAALTSANIIVGSNLNVATSTAVTGDVTISNTGVTTIGANKVTNTQLADNAVTFAKLQDGVANTVLARAAATSGDVAGVALAASQLLGRGPAGDITAISLGSNLSITGTTLDSTGSGGGIADGAILTTGLTFPVSGLHILDTDASHDLIISPGDNLTADRTFTITTGNANRTVTLTGDTTLSGSNTGDNATNTQYSGLVSNANHTGDATGSTALTIANSAVGLAKMANLAANSFIANNTGVAATPIAVTTAQATAMLNEAAGDSGSGGTKGLVPAPVIGDATKFLRGDMTYQTISGGGNALTSNPLSQFATTTSAQLAGVISDETGTDKLVFNTSPTLITPLLGTPTSGLLNSCTSNPNATGASPRTFQARAGDVFNVRDFGAVGDDSNDDTIAIAAALLAACSASRGATLYFPHGVYKVSDTFTGSFGVNNQMYGLTITGDGIGTTIIKQYGTNKGVFHITNTAVAGCLTLKDFSCWNQSGVMSTLQCIRYEVSQIANDDAHSNLQVSNLSITPPFGAGTWTIGLDLYRVHNGSILNYQYAGNNAGGGTGIVFQKSGSGTFTAGSFVVGQSYQIVTVGTTAFTVIGASANTVGVIFTATGVGTGDGTAIVVPSGANKSMACFIQGCQMNLCNTGVRIKDAMETCLIQECVMVGLVYGIHSDYCIHLGVSNSHINVNPAAYVAGTFVVGLTYEILSLGSPTPTDFTLIGAASNTVGVVFTATGVGAGNGLAGIPGVACIFSSGTGGDVDQSIIIGNLLYSQGYSNLVGIQGGFVRSSFSGNSFIALGGQSGTKGISVTGKGLSITGNSFYQHTNSYITSSATYSIISSNTATIDPGAVATTPYDITGTGTTSINNIHEP